MSDKWTRADVMALHSYLQQNRIYEVFCGHMEITQIHFPVSIWKMNDPVDTAEKGWADWEANNHDTVNCPFFYVKDGGDNIHFFHEHGKVEFSVYRKVEVENPFSMAPPIT